MDKIKWEQLSDGLIAKIPFQENVNYLLSVFYQHIDNKQYNESRSSRKIIQQIFSEGDEDELNAYKLVTEMVGLECFEKYILPTAYDKYDNGNINECKKSILKYSDEYYRKKFIKIEWKT